MGTGGKVYVRRNLSASCYVTHFVEYTLTELRVEVGDVSTNGY